MPEYRDKCGEVTAASLGCRSSFGRVFLTEPVPTPHHVRGRLRLKTLWEVLPARRQAQQAAQDETWPPLGIHRVIQPQVGNPAQQGVDRNLRLDSRELG